MTGPRREDVQAAFCAVLCDEWARAGVTDAVVAPGSRSTPLVVALDGEDRIRVHVVLDERSAGFVALGLGLASGRPAVVVTTSGTASVELHPAVVEAAQAGVPLIAATTDRPPELHHVGAPQTVEQDGLFATAVVWAVDPGPPELAMAGAWRSIASRAIDEAVRKRGPVHVNLPFREPLLGDASLVEVPPPRSSGRPWHEPVPASAGEPPAEVVELLSKHAGGRGLIVAGEGAGPAIIDLASRLQWPLLADSRSGSRLPSAYTVGAADALLRVPEIADRHPDIVLRAGAPWASKVLNGWLAQLPPEVPQILVDPQARWGDPDRRATHLVQTTARALSDRVTPAPGDAGGWPLGWRDAEAKAQDALQTRLDKGGALELSEPAVARTALASVPDGGLLVVSSSMPVRDVEWFGAPRLGAKVLANRGANGIDGVLSTAIGAAVGAGRPTTALIGDLAFLYDAGSLLWAARRDIRLSVIVVDNDGGGIFSFLPQAGAMTVDRFERYWGTPHGLDLAAVAGAYGVEARRIGSRLELDRFLARAGEPGCRVAIVPSNRADNVSAHDQLNAAVAAAVRA